MVRYILSVPDMSCQHCVKRIREELERQGIKKFRIDLEKGTVAVETDDIEQVLLALDDIGYSAVPQKD